MEENTYTRFLSINRIGLFPEKYFPAEDTKVILHDLKYKCDFSNRRGQFINDSYQSKMNGDDQISLIYEFYLACDSVRFILTYKMKDEPELYGFKLEPIEKDNSMILDKGRRLYNN